MAQDSFGDDMPLHHLLSYGPLEILGAIFSFSLTSLAIAIVATSAILFFGKRMPRESSTSVTARYLPEYRALSIGAAFVIIAFVVENIIGRYILRLHDTVEWWRFVTPLFCAFIALAVVLAMIILRKQSAPRTPSIAAARRTWASFSPKQGLIGVAVALLALLFTTVAAGSASSTDDQGRYVYLAIRIPNEEIDPIRTWFYGWAYGVPVLIALTALTAITWMMLQVNAARPYLSSGTVTAERKARIDIATASVRIATAGMLLALAGAWRLIDSASRGTSLEILGTGVYEVAWQYKEFAQIAGWLAPVAEVIAFTLLLLVVSCIRNAPSRPTTAAQSATLEEALS